MTIDSNSKKPGTDPTMKGVGDATLGGLPFSVGDTIAGKYRVDRVLGAGGMGIVLAGHHVALDQRVAIKLLKPSALDNAEFVARFSREARASARLRSEHVARVIDVGQTETGLPYMVMEYLSGKDLSRIVRERGPLSVLDACEYVMQACEGLAEAHRAGIIHRDLKPANLFLTKGTDGSPLVKVLDFGISKMLTRPDEEAQSEGLTQTSSMIGSPHYMSPEQLKSARDVDIRTDIWSLGGVLFKLLTNEAVFSAASTPELCVSILVGAPRDVRELRPDVPEALANVILKCLEKNPDARFASTGELAAALAAFAPPHSAQSVDRIVRVGTGADPRYSNSDPPPPSAAAPLSGTLKEGFPGTPPVPQGMGETAHVPMNIEMTTMTSSASSMSASGNTESDSVLAARLAPPRRSTALVLLLAGAVVATLLVVGLMLNSSRHTDAAPPPTAPPAIVPPVPPPATASVETAASPRVTMPSAAASEVPPPAVSAKATKPPPGVPPRPAGNGRPVAATPAAPPTTAAPAAPPPPTPQAGTVPDFGGRK